MSNSDPASGRLPGWLSVLFWAGFPASFGLGWAQTGSVWQSLAVMVVYGAVAFIVKSLSRVIWPAWSLLEAGATNDLIDFVQRRAQGKWANRYLQYLYFRHRNFDVKGLTTQGEYTLELEQVFVDLTISPEHRFTTNLITSAELQKGGHSIWEWLADPHIGNLAVIGPPGCGKTTLLKFMTLSLVARAKKRDKAVPRKLPVLLFLRNHAQAIGENPTIALSSLIQASLDMMTQKPPEGWFDRQLEKGRCLVMLDGLDEVGDPAARRKVVAWVETQMGVHHRNIFVISSRPHGYQSNPIAGGAQLEVRPFNRQQVQQFVNNWYLANEIKSQQRRDPGVEMDAQQGANDLLRRIRNTPDITELAVNPLLLTMIAYVHRYRSSLPGRRVELYAEMCEVLLGKREEARGLELDLTPAQRQSVLQSLAYEMMVAQKRELPVEEVIGSIAGPLTQVGCDLDGMTFIQVIENRSGILLEQEHGMYGFAHKAFQEYLAAAYVRTEKLVRELVTHIGEDWWHETIRLYCAQEDATRVIAACLAQDPPPVPALELAIECSEEALKVDLDTRRTLERVLDEGIESEDQARWHIAAEVLLSRRLKHLNRLDENTYIDGSRITQAEYQLFLNEADYEGYVPHHWQTNRFVEGQGKSPIVGVTAYQAEAFCAWLTDRDPGEEWRFRFPMSGETEEQGPCWINDGQQITLWKGQPVRLPMSEWIVDDASSIRALC